MILASLLVNCQFIVAFLLFRWCCWVDVPTLDAVLFLSARNSQVDVVQSVGRVMRKSPGKKYGYIIIPVVVPSDVEADKALNDNERYKVVWTVLNALRAHPDKMGFHLIS